MDNTPRRSRLARQQDKRMANQAVVIIFLAILFLVLFLWLGIPSLIKLAVALGNSKANSKFNLENDTIPPAPPQLDLIPVATTSSSLSLTGIAEAGVKVTLHRDQTQVSETTASNQGEFVFSDIQLGEGQTVFYTLATDTAGNQSQPSSPQVIVFDNKPPTLTITTPTDGQSFYGSADQIIDIIGSTDPNCSVFLNERQLVVTGDATFSTKHQLQEGDNSLKFISKDQADNQTEIELKVSYSR